jgi:putative DNA primase/helicase
MVNGCLEWQRNGLDVPASVIEASEQYFKNEDTLEQWLDDCVDKSDPHAFTTSRTLYTSWKIWAEARGITPRSETAFVNDLVDKGYKHDRTNKGRGFIGLALNANDLGPQDPASF